MKTLTGTWRDPSGRLAAYGHLHLRLNQDAVIVGTANQMAPREVTFPLDKNGALRPGSRIWSNDELDPPGTYYTAAVTALGGGMIWGPSKQTIQGTDATVGPPGPPGPPGQAATVQVGTVTTLPAGSQATVTNSGTSSAAVLNFGIPRGASGGGAGGSATLGITSDNMHGQPQPGQLVLIYTAAMAMTFPANFAGSYASAGAPPTSTAIYTVQINGNAVGTISFLSNGTVTFSTAGFSLNPSDRLTITAPDPLDPTLTDVGITLLGTVS